MKLTDVLHQVYLKNYSVQSNFARAKAAEIAALASLDLITTKVNRNEFGRQWRVTAEGYDLLREDCII